MVVVVVCFVTVLHICLVGYVINSCTVCYISVICHLCYCRYCILHIGDLNCHIIFCCVRSVWVCVCFCKQYFAHLQLKLSYYVLVCVCVCMLLQTVFCTFAT